jgi:hypothetical protein
MPTNVAGNIASQQSYAVPTPAFGSFTSKGVPDHPLLTLYRERIGDITEKTQDWVGMFCEPTILDYVEVPEGRMAFTRSGRDQRRAQPQSIIAKIIELDFPEKYDLASAVTADSWWYGMTPQLLYKHTVEPLLADRRLCTQLILGKALALSGWYNADQVPPPWEANAFDGGHDHYLSYANEGALSPEVSSYAKLHIQHHGVPGQVVCQINSATAAETEQQFGGFAESAAYENLPIIKDMVELGFQMGTSLAGVPTIINDWIPPFYALYTAFEPTYKPMMWRTTVNEETARLIVRENTLIPNCEFQWFGDYVRFGAATIIYPEMGVAVKLDAGGSSDYYVAPTGILDIAV